MSLKNSQRPACSVAPSCGRQVQLLLLTLWQSSMLRGFSPQLQISHNVVPKLHLSAAKLKFWGSTIHSGGTQGMRSSKTGEQETILKCTEELACVCVCLRRHNNPTHLSVPSHCADRP